MTIRTAVLVSTHVASPGSHLVLACPFGYTLILKDLRFSDRSGTAQTIVIWLSNSSPANVTLLNHAADPAGIAAVQGWIAMHENDLLFVDGSVGNFDIWASGTQLVGVQPVPPYPAVAQDDPNRG
jgi:hypothetical protein